MTLICKIDRQKTNAECWDEARRSFELLFEDGLSEAISSKGRVTQISIEMPIHGMRPGQPILGVKKK